MAKIRGEDLWPLVAVAKVLAHTTDMRSSIGVMGRTKIVGPKRFPFRRHSFLVEKPFCIIATSVAFFTWHDEEGAIVDIEQTKIKAMNIGISRSPVYRGRARNELRLRCAGCGHQIILQSRLATRSKFAEAPEETESRG